MNCQLCNKIILHPTISRFLINLNPSGANVVLQVFNDTEILEKDLENLKMIEKV